MIGFGVGWSGSPIPKSIRSFPSASAFALARAISPKRYGGMDSSRAARCGNCHSDVAKVFDVILRHEESGMRPRPNRRILRASERRQERWPTISSVFFYFCDPAAREHCFNNGWQAGGDGAVRGEFAGAGGEDLVF